MPLLFSVLAKVVERLMHRPLPDRSSQQQQRPQNYVGLATRRVQAGAADP